MKCFRTTLVPGSKPPYASRTFLIIPAELAAQWGQIAVKLGRMIIVHYISAHRYQPPEEFVEAILTCPDTDSIEYKRAFLENGGRALIRGER